jgi:tape measure domain-containing protein
MAQQSFGIELRAGVDVSEFRREIKAAQGDFDALVGVIEKFKKKAGDISGGNALITLKGQDAASGVIGVVTDKLEKYSGAAKETARALDKLSGAEAGSVTALRQGLSYQKQQLSATSKNARNYAHLEQKIRGYQTALNKAQGVQKGSIADLRQQAERVRSLSEQFTIGSVEQRRYSQELRGIQSQINSSGSAFSKFFTILNRVATIQAGITAFTAIIGQLTGSINKLTNQAKQIEGFELALKNVGYTSSETSEAFADAANIAQKLAAPIQQVEKSYKRMIPALQAVGSTAAESSEFIESITARSQTLGLTTEQSGRFLEAFAQVLSKGKLQSEELNQQISELDGAFRTQLADALGVTTARLEEMIEKGQVTSGVFVKAVAQMENGVDELADRVREGRQTVQQLQNEISNLQTANLRNIGASLEPGIKAIFRIQKTFEEFINSIVQSQLGKLLAESFNNIAVGAEVFLKVLVEIIKLVEAIAAPVLLLTRLFGFLLVPITSVTLAFATAAVTARLFRAAIDQKSIIVSFVKNLFLGKSATDGLNASLSKTIALKFADNLKYWGGQLTQFTGTLIKNRGNLRKTIKEMGKYRSAADGARLATLGVGVASAGVVAAIAAISLGIGYLAAEYDKATQKSKVFTDSLEEIRQAALRAGTAVQKSRPWYENLGRAILWWTGALDDVGTSAADAQFYELETAVKAVQKQLDEAGVSFKDYSNLSKLSDKDTRSLTSQTMKLVDVQKARLEQLVALKAEARAEGLGKVLRRYEREEKQIKQNLEAMEPFLAAIKAEGDRRNVNIKIIEDQIDAEKELNKKQKERKSNADLALKLIELGLQRDLSNSIEDQARKELLLASARQKSADQNINRIKQDIATLQEAGATEQGKDKQSEALRSLLTELLGYEKEASDAARAMADAVNSEVKRVFDETAKTAEKYAEIASKLASKVSQIKGDISSAASSLAGLVEQVFDNEIANTNMGFGKRKQAEEQRLRLLAAINRIEADIARTKLEVEYRLGLAETKRLQSRLRAEAELARLKGDTTSAQRLGAEATALNDVIALQNYSYQVGRKSLEIQRRIKDETLRQRALKTEINGVETRLFTQHVNRKLAEEDINKALGLQKTSVGDLYKLVNDLQQFKDGIKPFDEAAMANAKKGLQEQDKAIERITASYEDMKKINEDNIKNGKLLEDTTANINLYLDGSAQATETLRKNMEAAKKAAEELKGTLGGEQARWMGGPVEGGQTYRVNDAGLGREAFMNKFGDVKMLPAGSNIKWTAPSSGTIIPAAIVKRLQRNADINSSISSTRQSASPVLSGPAASSLGGNSGNLVKQMTAAMSASGGNQRITNNVTIQSQQPVTDASQIMTNVARMRLRNARRI